MDQEKPIPMAASEQSQFPTMVDVLQWRAEKHPARIAYTFLGDGDSNAAGISFEELDQRARAIAVALVELGMRGERALLLLPSGLEYITAFFGCLYAGVIAVPGFAIHTGRLRRGEPWFQSVLRDAQPAVAFASREIVDNLPKEIRENPVTSAIRWMSAGKIEKALASGWQHPPITGKTLAFLQYTSGSTSMPRGVMVSHANLMHNQRVIQTACSHTEESTVVSWLPLHHDMGLIGTVIQPAFIGARSVLMSPAKFLQDPACWLQAISRYHAYSSSAPNFAYDLCVRKVTPEHKVGLDLSNWKVAVNGAEPVRFETMESFVHAFGDCGFHMESFRPCYGLAESTLMVTGVRKTARPALHRVSARALEQNAVREPGNSEPSRLLVGCGDVLHGQQIKIVEPSTLQALPDRSIGEIWIAGPSVAQGYWGRLEHSKRTFGAELLPQCEGPYLRTGDLGFLEDKELFVTGRLKDLVIVRGRNLYPSDIEITMQRAHPSLKPGCGAAFTVAGEGEDILVVVSEVDRHPALPFGDLISLVRKAITLEHGVHVHAVVLVKTGTIPKTTSGKIKRGACRSAFLEGGLQFVAQSTEPAPLLDCLSADGQLTRQRLLQVHPDLRQEMVECYLRDGLARMLHIASSSIAMDEPLVALGLDSLRAMQLIDMMGEGLEPEMDAVELLQTVSLSDLTVMVLNCLDSGEEEPATHPSLPDASEYSLSQAK
jgi:acyl-CoA synthetase (AMP-forming)/AMP-acid ligase II/aryl carrier-like protein